MPAEKSYVFKREESRSFDQDVQFTRLGSSRCLLFCFVLFRGGGGYCISLQINIQKDITLIQTYGTKHMEFYTKNCVWMPRLIGVACLPGLPRRLFPCSAFASSCFEGHLFHPFV